MDNLHFLQLNPLQAQLRSKGASSKAVEVDYEIVEEEIPKPTYAQLLTLLEQRKPAEFTLVRTKHHHDPVPFAQRQLQASQLHHFERTNMQKSVWAESCNDGVELSASSMVG